jgi:ATP-binding cassette subfamily D (ALD) protein 4
MSFLGWRILTFVTFWRVVLQQSVSYFGSILSYIIIAIPIFLGHYDGTPAADLSAIISKVYFL